MRAFGPADTGEPRPLIGVPAVAKASTIALSGTTRRIQWHAVAGAARYRIAIGAREIETTSTHHDVGGLPPGPHTITVRAVDRYGIPGTSAAEISLRVVGLETEDGHTIDEAFAA